MRFIVFFITLFCDAISFKLHLDLCTDCEDGQKKEEEKKVVNNDKLKKKKKAMIYEGLFKLSTDSMDMIDDILNSVCVCTIFFFNLH